MWIVIPIAALLLASCAPQMVAATPAGGVLKVTGNRNGAALELAQTHCAKFGRNARISGQDVWNNTVTFDCVP